MTCLAEENITVQKKSKVCHLDERERYKIEGFKQLKMSNRKIAKIFGRSHSTINAEVKRGTVLQRKSDLSEVYVYKADYAQMKAEKAFKNKGTKRKIENDQRLLHFFERKIRDEKYSPDAALAAAKKEGGFKTMICTKTLYTYIDNGLFTGISNKNLLVKKNRSKHKYRKIRKVALNNKNGTSISQRDEKVNQREESGHWEIDLVVGKQGTKPVVLTLIERKSRRWIYVLLKNKTQKEVLAGLRLVRKRFENDASIIFRTITSDNGNEFLDSEGMKEATQCSEIYYAHPYSSWERGSNENGNRMLRRFIPKRTDLSDLSEEKLQVYEDWVNDYPRRLLGYLSAKEAS